MWKVIGWFAVAVIIAISVYVLSGDRPDPKNYALRSGPVIAFGDSLVYGTGSTAGNDFVSKLSVMTNRSIENMGIPGDTTAQGLTRIDTVLERKPAIVIVLLGGNDYLQRKPKEETFANLGVIIEKLKADDVAVILLGVRGGLLRDGFSEGFDALARQYDVAYVPNILDGVIGHRELMSDQVHPNDAGYAKIADRVYPTLMSVMEGSLSP